MPAMSIHPLAHVSGKAKFGERNSIGPFAIIEEDVEIGSDNTILPYATICRGTVMGNHNEIHMGAVIGNTPQDTAYKGGESFTRIGNHNVIREYVTIHRGTKPGTATVIGNRDYLMANAHVAHNCTLGDGVILVNMAALTGYCVVEDGAFLSGMTGLHQYTRVGKLSIVSALSAANKDIPPYAICGGRPAVIQGVNIVGLRRAKFSEKTRQEIRRAFKLLFAPGANLTSAVKKVQASRPCAEVQYLLDFIRSSKRGICSPQGMEIETLLSKKRKPLEREEALES